MAAEDSSSSPHRHRDDGPSLQTEYIVVGAVASSLLLVATILCICWHWTKAKKRRLLGGATVNPAPPQPKQVSQAGVMREPIAFVLPSISLENGGGGEGGGGGGGGGDDSSPGEGGSKMMSVTRCRQTTDTWLGLPTASHIDRDMYVSSEGDEATTPSVTGLGKVGLNIRYDIVTELLKVRILGATNLPAKFRKNAADPHVKVTLLPDKVPKFFTKVQRNTLNPIFGEEFAFAVAPGTVEEKSVKIAMCDLDRFSRRAIIGYIVLPLPEVGIKSELNTSVSTGDIWRDLYDSQDRVLPESSSKGELFLSLSYNPDAGALMVGIHKAKNIHSTPKRDKDIAALYAKVTLFVSGKFVKSKKTSTKKKTLEPEFEESFAIQIPRDRLQSFHVIVALCARTRLGGRCVLGRTQIGAFAFVSGPGFDHWLDALNSPKSIVAQWHMLS